MKFTTSLLTLLLSTLVASDRLSLESYVKVSGALANGISIGGQKALSEGGGAVPGNSPLTYCNPVHDDDILVLDHVNLTPNPPVAGNTLTIEASGVFKEQIEKGAYVILQVKYGLIRLVNQQVDLCDQISNVDLTCPVEKGKTVITKDVELPKEIPPGTYTVFADAYTVDKKKIICLEATVTFGGN